VKDGRARQGRRWKLKALLGATLSALMAGAGSVAEVEGLTQQMSPPMRRKLGIGRRLPDTTLRTALLKLSVDEARRLLRRLCRAAMRRKALRPVGLPFGVVAVDGKHVVTDMGDEGQWAQKLEEGRYTVRTLTCALVSARTAVCLDAVPIPAENNEDSAFPQALAALLEHYGRGEWFRLVSVDAGMASEANARLITDSGLDYLMALKENQPTLKDEAVRLLGHLPASQALASTDTWTGSEHVVRRLWLTQDIAEYHDWKHLKVAVRIETERRDRDGKVLGREDRYLLSSLDLNALTPKQWLRLVRAHWKVENDVHKTLDVAFNEDERPWFRDPLGLVIVKLLRRVAYNVLALYRSVTLRGEMKDALPWKDLLGWMRTALVGATAADIAGLRWQPRGRPAAPPTPA
jgi:predicted transposase YbfD/YdcC